VVNVAVLACVLRATTKKCTPEKIMVTPMPAKIGKITIIMKTNDITLATNSSFVRGLGL